MNHITKLNQHSVLIGQLVRFGLTGGLLTLLVSGGYWVLATPLDVEPMLSLTLSFLVFTGVGYILHSRWSFKDHGLRDNSGLRSLRFFIVNCTGFAANQFFVWLLVRQLGGPTWWPIIGFVFVTPLLTFSLNRKWVFA